VDQYRRVELAGAPEENLPAKTGGSAGSTALVVFRRGTENFCHRSTNALELH
jgi:hypothetical protein